ncbi:hypothetical protein LN042_19675 [Kitasatospora sp. RB6PN24]|uniref:hypothetical protein n=1 Tax=Kitasatospora humi TaxID=2893891 RepID=UPI001E5F9934|nr:hypothetical protein [Kitasatospora humi]MCC9309278.1 hypothetical protein [Kitasatospora humi]
MAGTDEPTPPTEQPPAAADSVERSAAAPLEPPAAKASQPAEDSARFTVLGLSDHQDLHNGPVELVDEDGTPLPKDLAELFDLTHPEWTVIFPRVRIYQRFTYPGSDRTVTQLLHTPGNGIPRPELEALRQALDGG